MNRRQFLKSTAATVATMSGTALAMGNPKPAEKLAARPNILYINVDDLGWTDLGFMGSKYYQTPNIDKLAASGVVFSNAYAPAANCAPSRACCMSGQYGPRHGIYTVNNSDRGNAKYRKLIPTKNKTVLADDNVTVAEVLQAGGYRTGFIGKWHLGKDPKTQGFDENVAGTHYGHPKSYFSPYKNEFLTDGPKGEYLTDRLTDEAMAFCENHQDKPFFLYFAYYTVHTPLQAKKEKVETFQKKQGDDQHNEPRYAAMIQSLDENIGRLVKKLDELKLRDNTLIFLTSDNGGVYKISRQWPLRAGKGAYYEGGIREPMFVSWPGHTKPGTTCDVPVSGIDFYPTFLAAADVDKPAGKVLDGVSILPLIKGTGTIDERPLFWHFPIYLQGGNSETQDSIFRTRPGSAVRLGDWKLIEYFEGNTLELYNLKDDIGEKTNQAKANPQKTRQLHELLKNWRKATDAPVPQQKNPKYDPVAEQKAREKKKAR